MRMKSDKSVSKRQTEDWYAARCAFRHDGLRPSGRRKFVYEERTILVKAASASQAIQKAEVEARRYARRLDAFYLGFVETYHLFDRRIASGVEVFSLMRSSNLSSRQFVTRYLDDGTEHRRR
jgi:hypothetical protein